MFTDFDILVCVILALSTLVGLLRGFIKETLSMAAWIGAAVVTFYTFPLFAERMQGIFKNAIFANIASVIIVFLLTLAAIALINLMVIDNLRNVRAGMFDRSLGMLFGFARGLLIVSVIHFVIILFAGKLEGPKWLRKGETYGMTRIGGELLHKRLTKYMQDSESPFKENEEDDEESAEERLPKSLRNLKEDAPKVSDNEKLEKTKPGAKKSWGESIDEYFGGVFGSSKDKGDNDKPVVIEEGE